MILNHKEAIRHLVNNHHLDISFEEACSLHYLLSDGLIAAEFSGKPRNCSVRIGQSIYLPIDSALRLENQLRTVCKIAAQIQNPFEQSFFLLVHISYLQTFIDVNKRTSRLSANIPLIKNNLCPLSFNDINKDDYASAIIAIYELNNTKPLAELYVYSYLKTCDGYDATAYAVGFNKTRVLYRKQRRTMLGYIITESLIDTNLAHYINTKMNELIPETDQKDFIIDIKEDLKHLSIVTIAGLGIDKKQLEIYLQKRNSENQ